jgi:hypothetical protein
MHWTRVSLLCLCVTTFALSRTASAQVGQVTDSSGVVRLDDFSGAMSLANDGGSYFLFDNVAGDGVGIRSGYSRFGLRGKLLDFGESHLFTEINGLITNQSRLGVNLGAGYRTMVGDGMLGASGWFDRYESNYGNLYSQFSVGAEYLHQWLDLRANGYMPFGNREHFTRVLSAGTDPIFSGNTLGTVGVAQMERSLSGFDFEGGVPLPVANWIRMYGGGYFLTAKGDDTWGVKSRVEARVGQGASVNFLVTNDDRFGTNLNLQVQLMFGRGRLPTSFSPDVSGYARRYDPVRRTPYVQLAYDHVRSVVPLINTETGNPFDLVWVDNTATAPGDGTIEHPFHDLPGNAPGADHILVRTGVGNTVGNIALEDNQHLWGEGRAYVLHTDRLGDFTIPDNIFKQTGPAPTLVAANGGQPVVTLANNNDVVNFNINGGTFGVFGQNITNFNLDSLVVNAANSLVIDNAHGVGNILNSSFAAQAAGTAAFISNTSPGRLDLTLTSVATSGGLDGFVVHAQDGGLIQANIDGFVGDRHAGTGMILSSDNGTLLANVTDAHILNSGGLAGSGFELRAQNAGQLGVSMNNVSARGNANGLVMNADTAHLNASVVDADFSDMAAGSGVVINASNAVVSSQFTNLTATNNGTDGFRIGAANGAIVASSIVNSNLNGNTDDNVQANVISGAKVNLFVDTVDAADSQTGNGFEFLVSDVGSNLSAGFVDTDLARSGLNAVSGLVTNGGTARVDMLNVQASDAAFNGMALTVSDGGNFTSVVRDSTFTRSGLLNNGVGLSLAVNNGSTALLDLGNTPFNANGARGFDFAVTGGALGGSTLNALVTDGNFSDNALSNVSGTVDGAGSVANLQLTDTTADNLGSQGGVNLAATNGGNMNVNWDGSASSISGTTSDGVVLTASNPNSILNFTFSDGRIRDNAEDGVNAAIVSGGAGTSLNVALNNATVINNGFNGVEFATAGAGAAGRLELNNTPLSNNGRSGLLFNSTTGSSLTILGAGGDFSNNGLEGINGTASGAGTLVGMDLTGATVNQNLLEGVLLNSTTGASLAAILNGATANFNGNENLRASAVTGGQLQISSTLSDFSNGGFNGAFDNVNISSDGAGSLATVFMDGVVMDNSTLNGLELTATNNGSLNADLRSEAGILSASSNTNGFGMLLTATNADQFIVTGVGPNQFNFNGLGGVSANVNTANVGVVGIAGSATANGGDGVNIQMDNVAAGAIAVRGPGNISFNNGDGIEVGVSNSTLVNVAANGQTINGLEIQDETIEGNTGDAINVHLDNVTMNSAGVISGNTINGQQNGIIVDMTNNSASDLTISNNTITDVAQLGISVTADSGNPHNVKIDNNTVLRSGSSNINVGFSGNTTVVDNLVIFQNTVDGGGITAGDGIGVNIVDATVLLTDVNNNTSSNNQGNGINIDASGVALMGPVVASGNTTNGNGADGMRYNQSAGTSLTNLSMNFNNADANGGNGMDVVLNGVAGNPDVDLSGNTVSNSALQGISLVANDTSLEDVRASQNVVTNSNGGDGIHLEMNNPGGAATLFSIVSSGNQVSGSLGTGINVALDGLDTTTFKPTIQLDGNTITNNQGLGVAVAALDMSINNLLLTNSTITDNTGGDGIFFNLNSSTPQTANRIEIDGTTSSNNGGNGATVAVSNISVGQFVMDGSTITNNIGGGLAYLGTDSSSLLLQVTQSNISANTGGDGVLFSLINSPTNRMLIDGNAINQNAVNGINLDADNSAIGSLEITNNSGGTVTNIGLGFLIDGNTFPTPGTPAWSIVNNSNPGVLLTGFTFDVAPSGHLYNTETGGSFPFTPELGSDTTTGLTTVNGTPVPPYPDNLVPDFSTLLNLAFADFQPGETFSWNIDADTTPGTDATVLGSDLIGSTITVNFSGGLFLSGALVAVPGNDDAAQFVATGGNNFAGGISQNGADGVHLSLNNGSNVGAMIIDNNVVDSNSQNGVNFLVSNSTLPGTGAPAIISNNTITNHANGDGVRLVLPDTNGTAIGMDFTNNTISGNTGGNGINAQLNVNAGGLTTNMNGNTINNNGQNGVRLNMTDNVVLNVNQFSGNTVNGNANMGVRIEADQNTQTTFNANDNVGNNTLSGNVDAGIGMRLLNAATANVSIDHTSITGTTNGADANFDGSGLQIITQDTARVNSLTIGAGGATADSNFSNNAGSGIALQLGITSAIIDPTIQSSTINANGLDGITINRLANAKIDNIHITDNTIASNGRNGVGFTFQGGNVDIDTLGPLTINAEIDNNTIQNNGANGVLMDLDANVDHQADIHDNIVSGNGNDGLQVRGRFDSVFNGTWDNNTITGNGRDGANITLTERAQAGVTIENSEISGSTRDGIRVDTGATQLQGGLPAASVLIQDNVAQFPGDTRGIHDNGGDGINLIAGSVSTQIVEIDRNSIANNALDGIQATATANAFLGVQATDNTILENGRHGVNLDASGFTGMTAILTDNQITRNARRGVSLVNSSFADTTLQILGTVDPRASNGNAATSLINQNGEIGVYVENNAGAINTSNTIDLTLDNTAIIGNGTNTGVSADDRNGVWIRVGTSTSGFVNANVDGNFFAGNGNVDFVTQSFTATPDPGVASPYTNAPGVVQDPLARLGLSLTNSTGDEIDVTRFGATYANADAFKSPNAFFDSTSRLRNAQRFPSDFTVANGNVVSPDPATPTAPTATTTIFSGTANAGGQPNQTFLNLGVTIGGNTRDITAFNAALTNQITVNPALPAAPADGQAYSVIARDISGIGLSTFRSAFGAVNDAPGNLSGNNFANVITNFGTQVFLGDGPGGNPDDDVFNQTFTWQTLANPFY